MPPIIMNCCCPHGRKATPEEKAARIAQLQQAINAAGGFPPASVAQEGTSRISGPAAAAELAPELAAANLELLTLEHTTPVWIQAFCGNDRDCIPAGGREPSFEAALKNAENWARINPSRFTIIYDFESRIFLHQEGPRGGGAAAAGPTRASQAAEIQRLARQLR